MKKVEVVCALIFNKDNKVFITQRGPGRALENKWEFPGGKVKIKETPEQALKREIKEELDSEIEILYYLCSSNYKYINIEPYEPFEITLNAYISKLISGKLELSEHINSKWVNVLDLEKYDFAPADIKILKELINYKNK